MKIIEDICGENFMKTFPPGHFWTPENGFVRYFNVNIVLVLFSASHHSVSFHPREMKKLHDSYSLYG